VPKPRDEEDEQPCSQQHDAARSQDLDPGQQGQDLLTLVVEWCADAATAPKRRG
jgi:hypothetical protein